MDDSISIVLLKNELIVEILQLGDESFLQNLKQYINDKKNKNNKKFSPSKKTQELPSELMAYTKPLPTTTNFETIVKQQKFKGIDRKAFDKTVAELDIQEPLANLIKMI